MGYYSDWYSANKEALSERRKKRYREDAEYRERTLAASRVYRQRRKEGGLSAPRATRSRRKSVLATDGDGNPMSLHHVGVLAAAVGRTTQCVSKWEKSGIIPATPFRRGAHRVRLYTGDMIRSVIGAVGDGRRLQNGAQIYAQILAEWQNQGVPVDAIGELEEVAAKMQCNKE